MEKINHHTKEGGWQGLLLFYSAMAMIITLFFSRAGLSISMIVFIGLTFLHKNWKDQFRRFFHSRLLWSMSLLFLLPFVSFLWSADKSAWFVNLQIKLPLLLMPLAFAGQWEFSRKQWISLALLFISIVTLCSFYSMYQYARDITNTHEQYLRAKTLWAPDEIGRVRFSWMLSIAILLSTWLAFRERKYRVMLSILLFANSVWLLVFLHIMAGRTGLLAFYLMGLAAAIALILSQIKNRAREGKNKAYIGTMVLALVILFSLPFLAYRFIPTFQNRVRYFRYDMSFARKLEYRPGLNDAVRMISIQGGWRIMQEHPYLGVGFGDIPGAIKKWYGENYPAMIENDQIKPSSQWLMYGAGCGWPGFILFMLVLLVPFTFKARIGLPWILLNISFLASFLTDIGLEIQFGVFLYTFFVLWFWKWPGD